MESAVTPSGFGGLQPSPSNSLGYVAGSTEKRLMHLSVHHLTSEDLPFHVLRIYLHGRNSPDSPWGLDGQPPPFLDPLITPHRFAAFAAAANSADGEGSPADPLQGALEELASPFVWACIANFFSAKVKELTAEELSSLRAFIGASEGSSGGPQTEGANREGWAGDDKKWPGTGGHCSAERDAPAEFCVSSPFLRCGRCGKLQLPPAPEGSGGRALGMLMGGPLYALRTVARLSEGIRLMSDRILRPHGIGAAVAVLVSHGFVSRSDGVKRVTGAVEDPRKQHSASPKRDVRRPPLPPDERKRHGGGQHLAAGSKRTPYGDAAGAQVLQRPFDTGRLLLRAASSPSALLDSLRRNGSPQDAGDATAEAKGAGGAVSGLDTVLENRLGAERGASTTSLEALATGSQQQAATSPSGPTWEGSTPVVETEAALALVITEEPPQPGGEGPHPAPGTRERGASMDEGAEPVVVPTFPPVSSMAVTSPLDPRRLSLSNPTLAPYTAAAATSLQKSAAYWGSGPPLAVPSFSGTLGGPTYLRQSFDRPVVPSPKHHLPGGIRGARRVAESFSDLSSPESQSNSSTSPQGLVSGDVKDEGHGEVLSGPVMSLADAARRSAGADAQHLRDAVQALQKSALAKLGTGPDGAGIAMSNDDSAIISRVTTGAAGPEPEGDENSPLSDPCPQKTPQRRGFNPLNYVLAAALAVHMIHMVATGIYLFGLKGTSFAVAWPQPFPAGASTEKDSLAWAVPVNSFWFRGEVSEGISLGPLVVSPPMEGPGMGPSPVGTAIAKWAGVGHRLGGSAWGILTVALSLPPLADLLCSVVGFWFFLAGDVRQEQLVCMAVAATMPKHLIGMPLAVYLLILVCGASVRVAFFGFLELLFMAAIKLLLCTLASMYASRIEKPNVASPTSTKESKLLASIAHECERAAEICSCLPFEGCTALPRLGDRSGSFRLERLPQDDIRNAYQKASLNGDGFGVGWYVTKCSKRTSTCTKLGFLRPCDGSRGETNGKKPPEGDAAAGNLASSDDDGGACVFTSLKPAWADRNLYNLAEKISSRLFFAHVRAASSTLGASHCTGCIGGLPPWAVANGSVSTELCCHPFRCGRFLFMHNGIVGGFHRIRRDLLSLLPDPMFSFAITNSCIDSACLFAMFLALLPNSPTEPSSHSAMKEAVEQMIATICWLLDREKIEEITLINVVVSDGESVVATRFVTNAQEVAYESGKSAIVPDPKGETGPAMPASLYFATGTAWEQQEDTCDEYRMTHKDKRTDICIVTSEPLTSNAEDWMPVPRNTMILITPAIDLLLYPIASVGYLPSLLRSRRRSGSMVPPQETDSPSFDRQISLRKGLATALANKLEEDFVSFLKVVSNSPVGTPCAADDLPVIMLRSLEGVVRELAKGIESGDGEETEKSWRALELKLQGLEKQIRAAQVQRQTVAAIEDSQSHSPLGSSVSSVGIPPTNLYHADINSETPGANQQCYELLAGSCALLCLESIMIYITTTHEDAKLKAPSPESPSTPPVAAKTFVFAGMQSGEVVIYDATSASVSPISFQAHVGGVLAMAVHANTFRRGCVCTGRAIACKDCGSALPEVFLVTGGSDTSLAVWDLSPLIFGGREPRLLSGKRVCLDGPRMSIDADDLLAVRLTFLPHQGDVLSLLVRDSSDRAHTGGSRHDPSTPMCIVDACKSCLQGIRAAMRLDDGMGASCEESAASPLTSLPLADFHKVQPNPFVDEPECRLILFIGFQSAKIGAVLLSDLLRYFRHTQVMVSVLANAVSFHPTQQQSLPLSVSRNFELKTLASGTYRVVTSTSSLKIVAQPSKQDGGLKIEVRFLPFEKSGVKRQHSHQSLVGPWLDESGHNGFVECLTSCGKNVICSGGGDGRLLLWGENGSLVGELSGHHGGVLCVAYTEAPVESLCRDLRSWGSREHLQAQSPQTDCSKDSDDVTHSLQGLLFSGSRDNSIRVWALEQLVCIQTLNVHTSEVLALAADAARNILISGSANGELFVWQLDLMVVAFQLNLNASSSLEGQKSGVSFTDLLLVADVSCLRGYDSKSAGAFRSSPAAGGRWRGGLQLWAGRGDGKLGVWNISERDLGEEESIGEPYDQARATTREASLSSDIAEATELTETSPGRASMPTCSSIQQRGGTAGKVRIEETPTEGQRGLCGSRVSGMIITPGASMPSLPPLTTGAGLEPRRRDFLPLLAQFVAYKSVSASRCPRHVSGCIGAAKFVAQLFEQALGATVDIVWPRRSAASSEFHGDQGEGQPHPVVFGRLGTNPQHPTIVFYSHYDVVSPGSSSAAPIPSDGSEGSASPITTAASPTALPRNGVLPTGNQPTARSCLETNGHVDNVKRRENHTKSSEWQGTGWNTNPWRIHCKDGYIYGRGVTDNKGPIICSLLAVKQFIAEWRRKHRANQATQDQCSQRSDGNTTSASQSPTPTKNDPAVPFNFVWICEGDEENGSVGLADAVAQKASWLHGTHFLICNNSYWADDVTPCLVYGMRGVLDIRVEVTAATGDGGYHSGVHGGAVEEPMQSLVHLLGRMHDPNTGRVTIPQFYDAVQQPDHAELQRVKIAAESVETGWIQDVSASGVGDPQELLRKRWLEPSMSLLGINASLKGNCAHAGGAMRIIPSTASAEISLRLVPKQVWGVEPLYVREGGSMPAIPFLADALRRLPGPTGHAQESEEIAVCQLPFGQASDNAHLPNERLGIRQVEKGVDVLASTLESLAARLT
ncbi:LOW QUALITY PROTEIN: uncharacterized protein EMH_0006210 [Eimeria mitis]|uniref:Glutamine amidotransferase type-2 domain-containing protein n=1 Tax=Eimeria mitis TaxID=44415 RepID=U6JY86_9EIME|nr:LOW QUALITY PROTEIN: uncharacterized protein EMH_0006210 [Eimeria mitis]CDJ30364.1 hypothetical protein EMH_0006210 [Eimeria mitis]